MTLLPSRLYKYYSASLQSISNLSNSKIWFADPSTFNDPFDCALEPSYDSAKIEDFRQFVRRNMVHKFPSKAHMEQIISTPDFLNMDVMKDIMVPVIKRLLHGRGVACFSEKHDDLLMWGHYTNCHKGFCLEFDTQYAPVNKALTVVYAQTFPTIDVKALLADDVHQAAKMLTSKSTDWAYEKEWRVINVKHSIELGYEREMLTGIYFGAKMPEETIAMIAQLIPNSKAKLFQMKQSKGSFALEAVEILRKINS